jgi:hypothetical protein
VTSRIKFTRKRPLEKPSRRWKDNIETDIKEVRWVGLDRLYVAADRDQWRVVVLSLNFSKRRNYLLAEQLFISQELGCHSLASKFILEPALLTSANTKSVGL